MRILILGGTVYLGRHLVDAALARGHALTLFNRGRSNPGLYPDLERLEGDREGDLAALRGRRWDAVIDTCGYLPRVVKASGEALAESIEHYTFVSTISVYADNTRLGVREEDEVARLAPGAPEELTGTTYGALKAGCEATLGALLPGRLAIVRAGLIFGPHDTTERSGYWPRRMTRAGEVLAPGQPARSIQLIDVRDLAEWIVKVAEGRIAGTFNATGPAQPLSMQRFLETCREVAGTDSSWVWVDEDFLLQKEIAAYSELPLWVPERYQMLQAVDISRALAAGLAFRPLAHTVRDTLEWDRTLPPGPRAPRVGVPLPPAMTEAREAELLEAWRAQERRAK